MAAHNSISQHMKKPGRVGARTGREMDFDDGTDNRPRDRAQ
jgi:hypothetical protein